MSSKKFIIIFGTWGRFEVETNSEVGMRNSEIKKLKSKILTSILQRAKEGTSCMKLHGMMNDDCRLTNCGCRFAQVFLK